MWQSYRDSHDASFFVVVDNNPPTPEQRKVAIDFTGRSEGHGRQIEHVFNRRDHSFSSSSLRKRVVAAKIEKELKQECSCM
jgi:hypothetical protein